ncbi:DUF1799 domain-containing protein [Gilliamella sp. B2889]|uniref:DUF1799 domain-containing protein n=1 Tax=Gilliamella sp. B2889 TaxID=2817985 RepID=UPI003A5CBF76|nr:DUF1799 domain-containing protein [Gilliamella sp. B2889]
MEIWQDNLKAFRLFKVISTQWDASMGSIIGLDYNCFSLVVKLKDICENERIFNI